MKNNSMDEGDVVYESMSHHAHVLNRPDSYVGGTEPVTVENELVAVSSGKDKWRIERSAIEGYVPALYKIIDEILVNAADHWSVTYKSRSAADRMRTLDIVIDAEAGSVSVTNDGRSIPIRRLPDHDNIYAVELIFGNLLTSSNYQDDKERTTGGRNGYGSKCTNIYSKEFSIETCDGKQVYTQTWRRNMYDVEKPVIRDALKGERSHTTVSFKPDFARLGNTDFRVPGFMNLLRRRALDIAAWCRGKVAVTFNGCDLCLASGLVDYARAYVGEDHPITTFRSRDGRWELVVTNGDSGAFEHISYVNGISTKRGGRHVEHIVKPLAKALATALCKRSKTRVTTKAVRSQLLLFVRAIIVNPSFDGQVKEMLTTPVARFGSRCTLPKTFVDRLLREVPELGARIVAHAEYRSNRALKRTDGSKTTSVRGIPKLCDATRAGGRQAHKCTLILTEGDSAKTMAISGLAAVPNGREWYGVFPLRGKLLNVRTATSSKISANTEIVNLKRILGLKVGSSYNRNDRPWRLRYGNVLIMTDQDADGSHIKGLLANLFHTYWPSLLRQGFLKALVTPIVKALPRRGKKDILFYNITQYNKWREANPAYMRTHRVKYYKGLGTSNSAEAKEYFSKHRRDVTYDWSVDDACDRALTLAFDKTRADDRKTWIGSFDEASVLDITQKSVTFHEFVHKELVHFSHYNVRRAIPSAMDGLKPSQRKVLFACFKRRLTNEIKVAQLAGYVSEHAAYHHGEVSLHGAIVNMAQEFVGSNNLALLAPCGQYGSRLMGGADSASPRYIFTRLGDMTRLVFPEADLHILDPLEDDGMKIEPMYYTPIIPTVLCNGAKGIGTGWSTTIPPHHPCEVTSRVRQWIAAHGDNSQEEEDTADDHCHIDPLEPWFRGFRGVVERVDENSFLTRGCCQQETATKVRVTELPIGIWNLAYTEFLEKTIKDGKLGLLEYEDHSTDTKVDFLLIFEADRLSASPPREDPDKFQRKIGLVSRHQCNYRNMHLFAPNGTIKRYESAVDIINDFCEARMSVYVKRHAHELQNLATRRDIAGEKRRFIEEVIEGTIVLRNRPLAELEQELEQRGYDATQGKPPTTGLGRYNHLHGMPLSALTKERAEALRMEQANADAAYTHLSVTTPSSIWLDELSAFEVAYRKDLARRKKIRSAAEAAGSCSKKKKAKKKKTKTTKKK